MTGSVELLEAGGAALMAGDWPSARTAFREALNGEETAEALLGLANAQWWLGEMREAIANWERAYAAFRRRPDPMQAAVVAISLSLCHEANFGNVAVSAGWAARAARLSATLADPVLDAWVQLAKATTCDDPAQVERWASSAYETATEAGDRDLELCALSMKGSALIDAGQVASGTALLDEALAGALGGEVESLDTVAFTSCVLMHSCVRCADFPRVLQWCRALVPFTDQYGSPYVMATCRAHYGAVLVATGDWGEAEEQLRVALRLAGDALPRVRAEASAFLADLRLGQGRVEEARRIVAEFEEQPVVLGVLAAACLASGEGAVAANAVQRRLGSPGVRRPEEARLREVLGEARLAAGDPDGAIEQGGHLVELGARLDCEPISARGARLLGRALVAVDPAQARDHLESARASFGRLEMPLEVARCRMALALAVGDAEPEVALAEARGALGVFERLGAARDADAAAAWLREAGATVSRAGARRVGTLTKRERDVLALVGAGLSNPEIAERLYISRRTVEHHVASILSKLGLRNRAEVALHATRHAGEELASK